MAVSATTVGDRLGSPKVPAPTALEHDVLAMVNETVQKGDAAVEVEPANEERGTLIQLLPTDPSAAKVTIHLVDDTEVDVWVGPYEAPVEILTDDRGDLIERLADVLRAVVAGRVEVRVKLLRKYCLASTVVLDLDNGPHTWYSSTLSGLLLPLPRKHESYAPYRRADG